MRLLDACPEFLILSFERKGGINGFMKTDSVGICSSVPSKRSMSESQLFCLASYWSDSSIGSIEILSCLLDGG